MLNALKAARLDDNTAVVVTSDHGEMLGERGLWCKDLFFEWSMRIPFIVRVPELQGGRRISANASLVDLLPTLLDIACVGDDEPVDAIDGRSLIGLMQGNESAWPDRVAAEYSAEAAAAPIVMIRNGEFKYVQAAGDPPQLYNLAADPDELDNLADRAEHAELVRKFESEIDAGWDLEAINHDIRLSQRRRALVADAMSQGRQESWDYEPRPDHSRLYVRGRTGSEAVDRKIRLPAEGYPFQG